MSVSIAWPPMLPAPLMETHALKPKPPLVRTEIERGAPAQRRRFQQVPTDVPFSCVLTAGQLEIFDAWLEHKAKQGARWFTINLVTGLGLSAHEARILSLEQYKELTPRRWHVSGVLEVRDRDVMTRDELDLVLDLDPFELMALLADFHHLVHYEIGQ